MKGDTLPVSSFLSYLTETVPPGAASEKPGIVPAVPEWIPENCIQCTHCSFACPYKAICPIILKEDEKWGNCVSYPTIKMMEMEGYQFAISVSPLNCIGCGACVSVCPGKEEKKALRLEKNSVYVDRKNQK